MLEWIARVNAAREALVVAYKPHLDGLLGIDRRNPRRAVVAKLIKEKWVVDVQDATGSLVERFAARDRAEAIATFFALHDGAVAPVLPGSGAARSVSGA